jgi:outer membrane protein insertion porin family
MKRLYITALLALTVVAMTTAQDTRDKQATGSQIIESVNVRGSRRIPEAEIKSQTSTRKRSVYTPERLDRDVRVLYDTGHFEDIKVFVEDGLHGGKIVTFEVRDRPLIFDIAYEGIDTSQQSEIKEEWSRQEIDLSKGSEYDPVKIRRAAKIIEDLLSKKENQEVKVSPYVEQQSATEVLVIFKVEVGGQRQLVQHRRCLTSASTGAAQASFV